MNGFEYRMSRREICWAGLESAGLVGVAALCFYDSAWVLLTWPFVFWFYQKQKKEDLAQKRKDALQLEFRDGVQALAAALAAGYSAENAIAEAKKDLQLQGNAALEMIQEFAAMQRKLDANQTLESAMQEFAQRSGLEEAKTFAEVFAVGKRSGGDLIEIMKDTAQTISETVETQQQVAQVLASRKYEQRIMNLMPFAIILYLRLGSPGFLDSLYHNLPGICAATLCLGIYGMAVYWGRKLLRIEV